MVSYRERESEYRLARMKIRYRSFGLIITWPIYKMTFRKINRLTVYRWGLWIRSRDGNNLLFRFATRLVLYGLDASIHRFYSSDLSWQKFYYNQRLDILLMPWYKLRTNKKWFVKISDSLERIADYVLPVYSLNIGMHEQVRRCMRVFRDGNVHSGESIAMYVKYLYLYACSTYTCTCILVAKRGASALGVSTRGALIRWALRVV